MLRNQGVTVVPVIIGNEVGKEDVKPITDEGDRVVQVKPTEEPRETSKSIGAEVDKAVKGRLRFIYFILLLEPSCIHE